MYQFIQKECCSTKRPGGPQKYNCIVCKFFINLYYIKKVIIFIAIKNVGNFHSHRYIWIAYHTHLANISALLPTNWFHLEDPSALELKQRCDSLTKRGVINMVPDSPAKHFLFYLCRVLTSGEHWRGSLDWWSKKRSQRTTSSSLLCPCTQRRERKGEREV